MQTIIAIFMSTALVQWGNTGEPSENLMRAVMYEWTVANCSVEIDPVSLVYVTTILSGAGPEAAERARGLFRERAASQFSDAEAACADLEQYMPNQ